MHLNKVTEGFGDPQDIYTTMGSTQIQAGRIRSAQGTSTGLSTSNQQDDPSLIGTQKSSKAAGVSPCDWFGYGILAVFATCMLGFYPVLARYLEVATTNQLAPLHVLVAHLLLACLLLLFTYTIPRSFSRCCAKAEVAPSAVSEPLLSDLYRSVATSSSRPEKLPIWVGVLLLALLMCVRVGCLVFATYYTSAYWVVLMTLAWPLLVGLLSWAGLRLPLPNRLPLMLLLATLGGLAVVACGWGVWAWREPWVELKARWEDALGLGLALLSSIAGAGFMVTAQVTKRQLSQEQLLWVTCLSALLPAALAATFITPAPWSTLLHLRPSEYTALLLLAAMLYLGELFYQLTLARIGAPLLSLLIPLRVVVAYFGSWWVVGDVAGWREAWPEAAALAGVVALYTWYYGMQWARRRQVQRQSRNLPEV